MSGCRADGIDMAAPATRPADVIGSWASSQPPGRMIDAIRLSTTSGSTTCMRRNRQ